ncbi:MAG TPA: hypothetical protein VKK31_12655 [Thermoanaerobaculia bacterium]|nr:hypothetical protein [Thermoanaerobaculia bacterium]
MRAASGWAAAMIALFLILFLALAGAAADPETAMAPETALAEGNRFFEKDEIEAALEAYAAGYAGDGLAGVLAYNAGTCALRLGRLPDALLWYRRAEMAMPGDPWLRDNLAMTRRALGDPPEGAGRWPAGRRWLAPAGVALAWTALALLILRRPGAGGGRGLLPLVALLACAAFAGGMLLDRYGPRAAVLLAPCPARGAGLPAGSEVRVRPLDGGGWRIVGEEDGPRCPAEAVGLVAP